MSDSDDIEAGGGAAGCSRGVTEERTLLQSLEPLEQFQRIKFDQKFKFGNMIFEDDYWFGIVCKLRNNFPDYVNRLQTLVIQEDNWLDNDTLADVNGFWNTAEKVVTIGGKNIKHLSINFQDNNGNDEIRIGSLTAKCNLLVAILGHATALHSLRLTGTGFRDLDLTVHMPMDTLNLLSTLRLSWLHVGAGLSKGGLFKIIKEKLINGKSLETLIIRWEELTSLPNHVTLPDVRKLTLMEFAHADRGSHTDSTLMNFMRIFNGVHELSLFDFVAGTQINLGWIINNIRSKINLFRTLCLDQSVKRTLNISGEDSVLIEQLPKLILHMGHCSCVANGRLEFLQNKFKAPKELELVFEPGSDIGEVMQKAMENQLEMIYPGIKPQPKVTLKITNQKQDARDIEIADSMAFLGMN